jgi:hypothetical protein
MVGRACVASGSWAFPRSRSSIVATAAAVALTGAMGLSCGGGSSSPASSSTPPVTSTPKPTPTPSSGSGSPSASSCPLGPGDPNAECSKTSPKLANAILAALDRLVQEQPQLFDKNDEAGAGTGQYKVLNKDAYLNGLVAELIAMGYCSERDPDDGAYERILLKNENGFSENFDVLTSSGYLRRNGIYFETCTPASFPVDRGGLPPAGSGCGWPYPPPISRMNCKLHLYGPDYYTLDSTAIVGPDAAYCAAAGFTDGRALCPVRPPDSPERVPCETWIVGLAQDTGQPGPTWTVNGQYCTGADSGCAHDPVNPYELLVYKSGTYTVCAKTGSCCSVEVER